jgi:hypothetical protein
VKPKDDQSNFEKVVLAPFGNALMILKKEKKYV